MRYFFIAVLLVLGCRSFSMDVDVSFEEKGRSSVIRGIQRLRDDLDSVLSSEKSPIYIMTVTRSSLNGWSLQPLGREELNDVICALKNIFKKEGVEPLLSTVSGENVCFDFSVERKLFGNAWKILVFNEMFFSQTRPLMFEEKEGIISRLKELSEIDSKVILYPNFLYTEKRESTEAEVYKLFSRMSVSDMVIDKLYLKLCFDSLSSLEFQDGMSEVWYLLNETVSINNGKILTSTKKSSYFHEADDYIMRGCLYDFGNGYDNPVNNSRLTEVLLKNISVEICLDLNLGIRKRNNWTNLKQGRTTALHLIQSNSIDPFFKNRENLPINKGIVHADSFPYPSWVTPDLLRPQTVYFPYMIDKSGVLEMKDDIVRKKLKSLLRTQTSDYCLSFFQIGGSDNV